jgi:hypothetical protein
MKLRHLQYGALNFGVARRLIGSPYLGGFILTGTSRTLPAQRRLAPSLGTFRRLSPVLFDVLEPVSKLDTRH